MTDSNSSLTNSLQYFRPGDTHFVGALLGAATPHDNFFLRFSDKDVPLRLTPLPATTPHMGWTLLLLAGVCEMIWPIGFKFTNGFTIRYWLIALTMCVMILSFGLMSVATSKGIPVGTAYAIWTGIGAAGTAVLGMLLFHEPRDAFRLACLSLIILGAVGLKFRDAPRTAVAPQAVEHAQ